MTTTRRGVATRHGTAVLWRRHAAEPTRETRAALMLAYWPLVREVAGGVAVRLPGHVDEADLISSGLFGLLSAIDRFDPGDTSRFEAFARQRVRGAIYDEMRGLDWAPRHVRERARELERTGAALEQRFRRRATMDEVARALGLTQGQVHTRLAQNLLATVAALDADVASEGPGGPVRLIETVEDEHEPDPLAALQAAELRMGVLGVIEALPVREARILLLHYRRGQPFRVIGAELGVSESRVSQVHTAAMRRLRDEIQALLSGEAFPLRLVVEAAAEALERLDRERAVPGRRFARS